MRKTKKKGSSTKIGQTETGWTDIAGAAKQKRRENTGFLYSSTKMEADLRYLQIFFENKRQRIRIWYDLVLPLLHETN